MSKEQNNYKYTLEQLQALAIDISNRCNAPYSVLLHGSLGAGKTAFSKFFIGNILIDKAQTITSPTFNIIQIYETTKGPVWHADLYRIKNAEELENLGLLEAMHENICLIEWPGLILPLINNCSFEKIDL